MRRYDRIGIDGVNGCDLLNCLNQLESGNDEVVRVVDVEVGLVGRIAEV